MFQALGRRAVGFNPALAGRIFRDPSGYLADRALAKISANPTVSKVLTYSRHAQAIWNEIDIAMKEVQNVYTNPKEMFESRLPLLDQARNSSRDNISGHRYPDWEPSDPLLNYQWFALIPTVLSQGEYITEIQTPAIRYDQQTKFKNGKIHHYAGFFSVDDMSLTIYTDVSRTAMDAAKKWIRAARSEEGLYGLPASYKNDVYVVVLDQADNIVFGWRYVGCWVTSWDSYNLQMTSAALLVTNLTISVDNVEFIDKL